MKDDEALKALEAMKHAWCAPMPKVQEGQYVRLFRAYRTETLKLVIDSLIANGGPRPGPAEMGSLLRSRSGVHKGQRPGPFLDEAVEPCTHVPPFVREALDAGKRDGALRRSARMSLDASISPQEATNPSALPPTPSVGCSGLNGKVDAGVENADPF